MDTDNRKSVDKPETPTTPVKPKSKVTETKKVQESEYTAKELADAHKTLGTSYEIVAVALKLAGKETATVTEAKKIIEKFKNKEVK